MRAVVSRLIALALERLFASALLALVASFGRIGRRRSVRAPGRLSALQLPDEGSLLLHNLLELSNFGTQCV